jgi:hypothetical protein
MSETECGFVECLAVLHQLIGSSVCVRLLGSHCALGEEALIFAGEVERGFELGPLESDPLAFDIEGVLMCLSERSLECAWRREWRAGTGSWLGLTLRLRSGIEIEIDELPRPDR